jgi:hypothetical protein
MAKITSVEYPMQVYPDQTFLINVTVQYSYFDWTIADLGIFAPNFTNIIASLRYYLTGNESKTFSFIIKAPSVQMEWKLNAITRYWYKNNWCYDKKNSVFPFSIKIIGKNYSIFSLKTQPTIVSIGESKWYYWNKTDSDTCVLWLGGGHAESNYVTINPYELESFGTMNYINDLAKKYSVLALYEGPYLRSIPCNNEVVHVLRYNENSKFINEVYSWIIKNGYKFAYLIGYSTGGVVVGYEVSKRDPHIWKAPNGAIIISAPLKNPTPEGSLSSIPYANNVEANILLMYGIIWSEKLWPQGKEFYEKLPNEGWNGINWYHKEWYLFPESGHEVWLKEGNGEFYDSIPSYITINFIQKSKNLSNTKINGDSKTKSSISMEIRMGGNPNNPYLILHAYTSKEGIDCSSLNKEGQDLLGNLSKYFDGSVRKEVFLNINSQIANILNESLRLMYKDEKIVYIKMQNQSVNNSSQFFKIFYNKTSKSLHWELNAEIYGTFSKSSNEGYSTDLKIRYFKAYAYPLTFYKVNDDGSIDFKTKFRINMANVLALEFSYLAVPVQNWTVQHLNGYGTLFSIETPTIYFSNEFGELYISYNGKIDAIGNAIVIQDNLSSPLPVPALNHPYPMLMILILIVFILIRKNLFKTLYSHSNS